jgi:ATP-dependent Clp protease ATP-binding subunit ClpC
MMRPDRFTEQAQEIIANSQELVRQYRHNQWDVEHVLLALLQKNDSVVADILKELNVDIDRVRERVEQVLQRSPKMGDFGG